MAKNTMPGPYVNDIPKDPESTKGMEYTTFDKMGIGSRTSGLPKSGTNGIKSLDHVGDSAGPGKEGK